MFDRFFSTILFFLLLAALTAPRFAAAQEVVEVEQEVTVPQQKTVGHIFDSCDFIDHLYLGDEYTFEFTLENTGSQEIQRTYEFLFDPDNPEAGDLLESEADITRGSVSTDDAVNKVTFNFTVAAGESETGTAKWEASSEYVENDGVHNRGKADFKGRQGGQTDACSVSIHLLGSITATKYEDSNANGQKESGESLRDGFEFTLEGTSIKKNNIGPLSGSTGATGNGVVTFNKIPPGDYNLTETLPSGWENSQPGGSPPEYSFKLTSGQDADRIFGNWRPGSIHGVKWRDDDEDGMKDTDERRLKGWTIELDNGATTTTDDNGEYWFKNLTPGTYEVSEVLKPGWIQTAPPGESYTVTLQSGEAKMGWDFGNFPPRDFGDAPDIYPTLNADDGPWHIEPPEGTLHLGEMWDPETDGQPDPGGQGDDADADGDDEDGFTFLTSLHSGSTSEIEVVVTATGQRTGFLNVWADLNRDTDFQEDREHLVDDEELGDGTHTRSVSLPEDVEPGPSVVRVRFSETENLGPRRSDALDPPTGEVEDYVFDVTPEDVSKSESAVVKGDGRKEFFNDGTATINFSDVKRGGTVQSGGLVSVIKGGDPPKDHGIPEESVAPFSHVIETLGLSFGTAEVCLNVSEINGANEPSELILFSREQHDDPDGNFNKLNTTHDDNGTSNDISDDVVCTEVEALSEFAVASSSPDNPLPVELAGLEATLQEGSVFLTWRTASETNNAGFHVERRGPRSSQWTKLGFVEGAGMAQQPQTYEFVDEDLPFTADSLSYRLRQVDADGSSSLSEEITVRREGPESVQFLGPYPNPARSQTTVRYALPSRQRVRLAVYDALGRRVMTLQNGTVEAGRTELRLDTSRLSPGMYFLRLAAGETSRTRRLTVLQ